MDLGEIIKMSIEKDLSQKDKRNKMTYEEKINDEGHFCIRFGSEKFKEATLECSVPYTGDEQEKNYLRTYFLSMAFNAAIHGMKRMNHKKHKI